MIPQVDIDIVDTKVTSVVRLKCELIVDLGGGRGAWWHDGKLERHIRVDDAQLTFGLFSQRDLAESAYHYLTAWRDAAVSIRMTGAGSEFVVTDGLRRIVLPRTRMETVLA